MKTHDPLCPWNGMSITIDGSPLGCFCDLIAKVRNHERARIVGAIESEANYYKGNRDEIDYMSGLLFAASLARNA